ncbi:MAG: zinc-dependent metalloprotease [Planctomycetales bacterium]|nr:zinc-dependent metalloprotease [Planctomycetales bacterium]
MRYRVANCWAAFSLALTVVAGASSLSAQEASPDYPPLERVTEGYTKVVSTADGRPSFYTIWKRDRDNQLLAEIPKDFARQKHFIALTVSSGDVFAGLQAGDMYVYWRQYGNRMALIAPNLEIRSTGDNESRSSVRRLFTDTVLLDVPIVAMVPRGGPVVDLDDILVRNATVFFGNEGRTTRPQLAELKKVKAFPDNIEIAIEVPAADGHLTTLSYSISLIPESTGYQPRRADERIGYFVTAYRDLGKYDDEDVAVRFINRWHLEKRDPSLRVSPPKNPIVFYLEHTTPVRYRRWVREGVEYWNEAFERVGISNAIEVYYQDAESGAYMDLDPEDVRYNFIRWLNNDIGTAIGPSRVNPMTGQILDADIVLTDGWIRHFETQFTDVMPKIAMEGMNAETLAWLAEHPTWDPRVRLAHPADRDRVQREIAVSRLTPFAGDAMANVDTTLLGDDQYDGLIGRVSQVNGMCMAAEGRSYDMAVLRMMLSVMMNAEGEETPDEPMLDGIPESFIGPLLADLVAHEVGHTLGLRHNFKASSIYTLDQINGEVKGKPFAGSVMDYIPINYRLESGELQGDFGMVGLGPYDYWAIEYGYTFDNDLSKILSRVAEPELVYATDEDTSGPDPLARRYDFSADPLDFAQEQVRIAVHNRATILDKFVQDGQSWSRARTGYELTLRMQASASSMMAGWVGGTFVNRDKKGDPNGREPLVVIPVEQQRAALKFIVETSFRDDSYGLTPELLRHMTTDKWLDEGRSAAQSSPAWPIHDRILGLQASTLTQLMNPSTLQGVYDNEFRVPLDQDALTLPEMMQTIRAEIWSELGGVGDQQFTSRQPAISSLRRNLQREHLERLIDLMLQGGGSGAASKPIATLALSQLQSLKGEIEALLANAGDRLDPYTKAHLQDSALRINKAIDASFVYNAASSNPAGPIVVIAQPAGASIPAPVARDLDLSPANTNVLVAPAAEAGSVTVPATELAPSDGN